MTNNDDIDKDRILTSSIDGPMEDELFDFRVTKLANDSLCSEVLDLFTLESSCFLLPTNCLFVFRFINFLEVAGDGGFSSSTDSLLLLTSSSNN